MLVVIYVSHEALTNHIKINLSLYIKFSLVQHIPVAHVTTHEWYVPPVYATGEPTITAPDTVRVPFEMGQYAEIGNDANIKGVDSMANQLQFEEVNEESTGCSKKWEPSL